VFCFQRRTRSADIITLPSSKLLHRIRRMVPTILQVSPSTIRRLHVHGLLNKEKHTGRLISGRHILLVIFASIQVDSLKLFITSYHTCSQDCCCRGALISKVSFSDWRTKEGRHSQRVQKLKPPPQKIF